MWIKIEPLQIILLVLIVCMALATLLRWFKDAHKWPAWLQRPVLALICGVFFIAIIWVPISFILGLIEVLLDSQALKDLILLMVIFCAVGAIAFFVYLMEKGWRWIRKK